MALAELAALAAASQNNQKSIEVIQDRSVRPVSPFSSIRHNEPFDFSGSTLGTGLTPDFSLSEFLTPASEAPRYTLARQDSPASSDIPWGAVAAGVGFLGYEAAAIAAARRSKHPWKTFGLTQAAGAFGVSCAAPMAEVLIIEKSPFTLSAENAVARIQERGTSFMIGNSKASLTDISCTSDGGTFSKITLKDDRSSALSTAAFCTARLMVGDQSGLVGLVVQDTGDVFIANAPNGHFSIDIDGKNATGQLQELTVDNKLDTQAGASFGATLVDGKVKSISWVRIGDKTSTVDASVSKEATDSFVSLVSKPEFFQVSAVIGAALLAPSPESTSASESSPTSQPTETNTPLPTETPTAVPTPTEIPDPTMPLGETGKDAEGTYVKMENGDIARKVEYKTSAGEILYEGWAVEKTQKGGIPLLDVAEFNLIPTRLYVASDVLGGHGITSLTHIDSTEQSGGYNTLGATVIAELGKRKKINLYNQSEMGAFFQKLIVGDVTLPFTTSTGESAEGKLGPDTGFITIVVPYDSLTLAEGNGVSEWTDVRNGNRFRSTMLGVDASGNAIGLIASQTPLNELPDSDVRLLTLFHAASIIAVENQQIQGYSVMLDLFVQYADKKGDKTIPDIIITRNP